MFGRLDEDPDLEKEYMIVSDFIDEDPLVFNLQVTPERAKEAIRAEIETFRGVTFSVYELVEHAEVEDGRNVLFVEDWARKELDNEQEDQ